MDLWDLFEGQASSTRALLAQMSDQSSGYHYDVQPVPAAE